MFATQLIRILDTLPTREKNANCVFDTDCNMKENQNEILFHINSPRRHGDPLATEINDKDGYWNTPEFECAMGMDDFTNVNGSEIKRSHPQLHSDFFEKETNFCTDKNVTEFELPELMICYKENSAYHVKDICVDEGVHSEESNLIAISKVQCDDTNKGSLGTELFKQDRLKSSSGEDFGMNAGNECGTQEEDSDLREMGDHTESLIQDGLKSEDGNEEKGKGHNGHLDLSERNTDTKSLFIDDPQSLTLKDFDAADHEFRPKLVANIELPVPKGIQESSDDSEDMSFSECGPALNTDQGAVNDCGPEDVVQTVEESVPANDKLMYDASAEESDSNSMSSGKTFRPQTSLKFLFNSSEFGNNDDGDDGDDDDEQQPNQIPVADMSLSDSEEVSSSDQASNLTFNSKVESEIIGLNLETEKVAAISENETFKNDHNLPIEEGNLGYVTKASQGSYSVGETSFSMTGPIEGLPTYVGPTHEDETSGTASLARLVQRGDEESMVGPVSCRITDSGPIPFSGSISLRSESSTTSTRSFAFPVLQNEWNSSPARMAKAERRRFHKHRAWRQALLCCKFK